MDGFWRDMAGLRIIFFSGEGEKQAGAGWWPCSTCKMTVVVFYALFHFSNWCNAKKSGNFYFGASNRLATNFEPAREVRKKFEFEGFEFELRTLAVALVEFEFEFELWPSNFCQVRTSIPKTSNSSKLEKSSNTWLKCIFLLFSFIEGLQNQKLFFVVQLILYGTIKNPSFFNI